MFHTLLDRFVGSNLTPATVGRILLGSVSCPVLVGYLLVIFLAAISGAGFAGATLSYFVDAFAALSEILAILLGYWLFYLYFHSVIVSFTETINLYGTLAHFGFQTAWSFISGLGIIFALGMAFFNAGAHFSSNRPRTSPFSFQFIRGLPKHLTTGWTAAHCPQVLYQ